MLDSRSKQSTIPVGLSAADREHFRSDLRLRDRCPIYDGPMYVPTSELDEERRPKYHGTKLHSVVTEYGDPDFLGQPEIEVLELKAFPAELRTP